MPKHAHAFLTKHQHPTPKRKVCTLCKPEPIQHSKQLQLIKIDNSAPSSAKEIKALQSFRDNMIIGQPDKS